MAAMAMCHYSALVRGWSAAPLLKGAPQGWSTCRCDAAGAFGAPVGTRGRGRGLVRTRSAGSDEDEPARRTLTKLDSASLTPEDDPNLDSLTAAIGDTLQLQVRHFQALYRRDPDLVYNTFAVVGFGMAVFTTFLTIDASISRGWSPAEVLMRMPLDNWKGYESR